MNKNDISLGFSLFTVNIGQPRKIFYTDTKSIFSAIDKKPIQDSVFLGKEGLEGDGSADLRLHGGADKAVCAYSKEHYLYWKKKKSIMISPGEFGENLTLTGINEATVYLGDVYKSGGVKLQVSQPRIPCQKINKKFGRNDIVLEIQKSGYTGFYFRVLEPGKIKAGDYFSIVRREKMSFSIAEVNMLINKEKINTSRIKEVLNLDYVSEDFKIDLRKTLKIR